MKKEVLVFLLIAFYWGGCSRDVEQCAFQPVITTATEVTFESLEDVLPAITTKDELVSFLTNQPVIRDQLFNRPAYPDDSVFINELFHRFTNPHIDSLLIDTKKVFGDLSALKEEFKLAFANLQYYYPDFKPPVIKTMITGLETDLYVSDSIIVIGLDYYLGAGTRYRPNMYDYMLRRYEKEFIVPSVMLLYGISSERNAIDLNDHTVLGEMVAYGKAYYFTKQMLPCVADSMLIGYSTKEMAGSQKYEELIWARFIEDQVLYATSHLVKQKYIAERPKTLEVGTDCPGRIGTWVGWQMVKDYMDENPNTTLPELMQTTDANKIFRESKYKPI